MDTKLHSTALQTDFHVAEAVAIAFAARGACGKLTAERRSPVLATMALQVDAAGEDLAQQLVTETRKPVRSARAEVSRTVTALRECAAAVDVLGDDEAGPEGEYDGRLGVSVPEPIGLVAAIVAVDSPLLIAAQQLGPALGAGCPVVIKAPERAPLTVLTLAEIAIRAGWPAAGIEVLAGGVEVREALTADPRVSLVSFSGSAAAGRAIARQSGAAELLLQLGSGAASIVAADADLGLVVDRCAAAAFASHGRSAAVAQRLFVHRSRYREALDALAVRVAGLRLGDPREEETDVGAMLDERSAQRTAEQIDDAVELGAELRVGGDRDGCLLEPTLVAGIDGRMRLSREEAFGPLIGVGAFAELEEAIGLANAAPGGVEAGVFTSSVETAALLASRLEVGGVHINEAPGHRCDRMFRGGGPGGDGPCRAMDRMTRFKSVTV